MFFFLPLFKDALASTWVTYRQNTKTVINREGNSCCLLYTRHSSPFTEILRETTRISSQDSQTRDRDLNTTLPKEERVLETVAYDP